MIKFTLPLVEGNQRPIIRNGNMIDAMLDTGALFPVWTFDESLLVESLNAEIVRDNVTFGGFGGDASGKLFRIPTFSLGELSYTNLYIIAHKMNLPFHMIVSATMLNHLKYEIDDENHLFSVTIPDGQSSFRKMMIKDSHGKLHVLCSSDDEKANHTTID